jgi:hypothetical protein
MILSAHSISFTRVVGVAKVAFFPIKSDWLTPRAREQAVQTWIWISNEIVFDKISLSGGQPTGTTESERQLRMSETASPNRNS